jgi:hypothetical protein
VSYRLCKKDETEEEAKAQQRAIEPMMNGKMNERFTGLFGEEKYPLF